MSIVETEIAIIGGGQTLALYSGEFLDCLKERDFSTTKKFDVTIPTFKLSAPFAMN